MSQYKLKDQYKGLLSITVNIDGNPKVISKSNLERESKKYIQLGFGFYFDISQKEAMKIASDYTKKVRKAKLEADSLIEQQEETLAKQSKTLVDVNKKLTKASTALKKSKELLDNQQSQIAEAIQERQAAQSENEELKAKLAELNKKLKN